MPNSGLLMEVRIYSEPSVPGTKLLEFKLKQATSRRRVQKPRVGKKGVFIPLTNTQAKKLNNLMKSRNTPAVGFVQAFAEKPNTISVIAFFPFGRGRPQHQAARSGIGTRVHLGISEFLARHYASHRIRWQGEVSPYMRKNLEKLGIKHHKTYSVERYRELLRRAINPRA